MFSLCCRPAAGFRRCHQGCTEWLTSNGPAGQGFEFAQQHSQWGFEIDRELLAHASNQEVL